MPAIIVISNPDASGRSTITLEERVVSAHLEDGHTAEQLVERLGWAILDAEAKEAADRARDLSPGARFDARSASELRPSERALAA